MWVRGLKLVVLLTILAVLLSHPMWVRGLKLVVAITMSEARGRTPCGCVD